MSNNQVTEYSYNGAGQVIGDQRSDGTQSSYVRGDRVLMKRDQTYGKDYYYLYNGHGDVVQMVSTDGSVVNSYQYDEWGNVTQQNETVANELKYAGETYDAETGLYYLKARYYDPNVGRFLNEDTVEGQIDNPLSMNVYTYVENDPINKIDPSGNEPQKPSRESPFGGAMPPSNGSGNRGTGGNGGGGGIIGGAVLTTIAKLESVIRTKKIEYGQFFDKLGNKVTEVIKGKENSIDIGPYQGIAKDKIFTHNHPTNGPFSLSDISKAVEYDMAEIRAVLPNGTNLSLKRIGDNWKISGEEIDNVIRNAKDELRNDPDTIQLKNAGKVDEVWEVLIKRIASKVGGEYRVEK
ncbi:RHS repeat-associated core domain-containing protein [Paenibacillus campi]|uniref:RHS repeat domain-containing protein n=1 Tax=Paenibacillus campi TaxID=3106031 RepID=UPI002AFF78A0|nr:RHS repeat-associated core domain-containing protein [Paenibacillus sp. SGZ-1009]